MIVLHKKLRDYHIQIPSILVEIFDSKCHWRKYEGITKANGLHSLNGPSQPSLTMNARTRLPIHHIIVEIHVFSLAQNNTQDGCGFRCYFTFYLYKKM